MLTTKRTAVHGVGVATSVGPTHATRFYPSDPSTYPAAMYSDHESEFYHRAWQLLGDISDQLARNQKSAASLVQQASKLKVGLSFILVVSNGTDIQ